MSSYEHSGCVIEHKSFQSAHIYAGNRFKKLTRAIPIIIKASTSTVTSLVVGWVILYASMTYVLANNGSYRPSTLWAALFSRGRIRKLLVTAHPPRRRAKCKGQQNGFWAPSTLRRKASDVLITVCPASYECVRCTGTQIHGQDAIQLDTGWSAPRFYHCISI